MTIPATIGMYQNPVKRCPYDCGTLIFWDNSIEWPKHFKWKEKDTGLLHDLARCCHIINQNEKKEEEKKTTYVKRKRTT